MGQTLGRRCDRQATPRCPPPGGRATSAPSGPWRRARRSVTCMPVRLLRPVDRPRERVPRLVPGLVLCGLGIAFMVAADLGLAPWSVLDQGISQRTGIPIGTVSIVVGALVLLAWVPLDGPGSGPSSTWCSSVPPSTSPCWCSTRPAPRSGVAYLAVGVGLWGPGSGLYIGAGLGPGPRDGLMTELAARGVGSIRLVRTGIELTALAAGWLLGGSVGLGTLAFALTIGPNVQLFLPRLTVRDRPDALSPDGPRQAVPGSGASDRGLSAEPPRRQQGPSPPTARRCG